MLRNAKAPPELRRFRRYIAAATIELRRKRGWTQAELASRIGLSQGHVSNIERGQGSFSAEQLLLLMQIFNVDVRTFQRNHVDPTLEIQNALARFGAKHLHESENVLPSQRLSEVNTLVLEALSTRQPRLMTALAPVVVLNIDSLSLRRLHEQASVLGLARRLAWLVENILEAIRIEQRDPLPREWVTRFRRAETVIDEFIQYLFLKASPPNVKEEPEILDAEIRSKKTIEDVRGSESRMSRTWRVVTRLQPEDFAQALRTARVDH